MDRRQFITAAALGALLLPYARPGEARTPAPARRLPPPLDPGDTVALVSPSSATDEPFDLQLAREAMEALGLRVKLAPHLASRHGHLAGTDAERAGDLNAMFADREVKAIVCARGGSGAARLLPLLDYGLIARNPKILLGYSDITALHCAIHARTGLVPFHGPIGIGSWNAFNADQFRRLFFQREQMQYANSADKGDELVQRKNRTVTITGCSKAFAMTGWRIGYCGGPKEIITAMATIQGQSTTNACSISQKAATAALNGDQACVAEMNAAFKARHDFIVEGLNSLPGVSCARGAGTFYAFADVSKAMAAHGCRDDVEFAELLLSAGGVAVVPGSGFGAPGHMRLSFACSMKTLEDALERMRRVLTSGAVARSA